MVPIKFYLSWLLFFLLPVLSQAQNDYVTLSKSFSITPPSPNAAALGQYGNTPVGLATGTPQVSIPLYTLKTQHLELPIGLSYSTNGIKIDQVASRTGIDWVLNAGGVITRTVYGSPDEFSTWLSMPPNVFSSRAGLSYLRVACEVTSGNQLSQDTQPDVFSFNFNGYNGRFTLDSARNIVLIKFDNLKIEKQFTSDDWNFKVTTGNGIMYYFGGIGATETTRNVPSSGICEAHYVRPAKTAWYLKKIVHPLGDSITFNYTGIECIYETGVSQTIAETKWSDRNIRCGSTLFCTVSGESTCLSKLRLNAKALNEINTSAGDKIKIINSNRLDINNEYLIDSIEVYHKKNLSTPFKVIDLVYNYSNSREPMANSYFIDTKYKLRPFLTEVIERGGTSTIRKHAFAYNDYDGLPARLSFSQDHYGYANGKSNAYLVPGSVDYKSEFPLTYANRSPDPAYAVKGVLSRITFPTGGYDTLMYEGHTISQRVDITPPLRSVSLATIGSGVKNAKTVYTIISPLYNQDVIFHFACNLVPGESYEPLDNYAYVRIYSGSGTTNPIYWATVNVGSPVDYTATLSGSTDYRIEITAYGEQVEARANFEYGGDPTTPVDQNVYVGGVRIAKIQSFTPENGLVNTRKFYYGGLNAPYKSSGQIVEPVWGYYEEYPVLDKCALDEHSVTFGNCFRVVGHSSTMHNLFGNAGSHIYYGNVIEGMGEDFENGGISTLFKSRSNDDAELLYGYRLHGWPVSNVAWENGLKSAELFFSKENNQYKNKKEVTYNYKIETRNVRDLYGYIVRRRHDDFITTATGPTDPMEWLPWDVVKYSVQSNWNYLDTTVTNLYDDVGAIASTTKVAYTYDNPLHDNPTRVWTIQSDGAEETISTSYPLDYATGTPFIDSLKAANMVDLPIEKVKYSKRGTAVKILAGSITKYYPNSKGLIESEMLLENAAPLPLANYKFSYRGLGVLPPAGSVSIFQPDPGYKGRVNYDNYDGFGNIGQFTVNGGTGGCYLWAYNSLYPVAAIKNAGLSDVAYTSFESADWGNWISAGNTFVITDGLTGTRSYTLQTGSISKTGLVAAKKYIVSYWAKAGASIIVNGIVSSTIGRTFKNWTYHEKVVSGVTSITVSGTGGIDELRLFPVEALMNTTTYEPSVGVTSSCDTYGNVTYYEYDLFGRLKVVKDLNGMILKQYDYQYQAPVQQ
ncbi:MULTISPECIES: hypothetical protein [unclassified Chitinophaga]|uniref:hypothetical protein n=1 Tax=unclassified Chitinophaga TaxID=2619133 RepID=UPI00301056E7